MVDSNGQPYETGAGVPFCSIMGGLSTSSVPNAYNPALCDDYMSREAECAEARAWCFADHTSSACNDVYCLDEDGIFGNGDEACSCYASYDCVSNNTGYVVQEMLAQTLDEKNINDGVLGSIYMSILNIGVDLDSLFESFEVGARFELQGVDAEGNALPDGTMQISESWNEYVFSWPLGCSEANDQNCLRRPVSIPTDVGEPQSLARVSATYSGTFGEPVTIDDGVGQVKEQVTVQLDSHSTTIHYGSIMQLAMQEVVYPSACPGCSSFHDVLSTYVDCTNSDGTPGVAAEAISDAMIHLFGVNSAAVSCQVGIGFGAQEEEDQRDQLLFTSSMEFDAQPLHGLAGGGRFVMEDENLDGKTEQLRQLEMSLNWADPNDPLGSTGFLLNITGAGRTAADGCLSNADCALDSLICQELPHYLGTLAVESVCFPELLESPGTTYDGGTGSHTNPLPESDAGDGWIEENETEDGGNSGSELNFSTDAGSVGDVNWGADSGSSAEVDVLDAGGLDFTSVDTDGGGEAALCSVGDVCQAEVAPDLCADRVVSGYCSATGECIPEASPSMCDGVWCDGICLQCTIADVIPVTFCWEF